MDDLVGRERADLGDGLMETIRQHEQETRVRIVGQFFTASSREAVDSIA